MKSDPLRDNATSDNDEIPIRRWNAIKKTAGLVVVFGILLSGAGTAVWMISAFKNAAEGKQAIPVDSLATSIESSLYLGAWLSPFVVAFAILWFVARARLRALRRSRSWPNQIA
jgi:hypothetical protein